MAPAHGFWLLDEDRVMVETFSAELNLAQPQETSLYGSIFDSMASVASVAGYGRAARAIIARVLAVTATGSLSCLRVLNRSWNTAGAGRV